MRSEASRAAIPGVVASFGIVLGIVLALVLGLLASPLRAAAAPSKPAQAAAPTIYSAQTFLQELQRLKAELQSTRDSTEKVRAFRESLPEAWVVDAGGKHYDVPAGALESRLLRAEKLPESRAAELDQAIAYLDALAAETASAAGSEPPAMDSASAKLKSILAGSEYSRVHQDSWWDRFRNRIAEMMFDALQRLLRGVGGQKSLGSFLLWLAVCAAAVLIAYWIFRNWFRAAKAEEMALQAAAVPVRSWQEWVYAARAAAERGDYREAIHCAYWTGIARLQDLGALAPDRAKTPREYLGALSKSKILQPETFVVRRQALSALTTRMETIWYGYRAATEADYRDSLSQLETLGCRLP